MALGQLRSAVKGKTDAAREIADRLEGRARQAVELSGRDGSPIDISERLECALKGIGEIE
jgi:hypothetical protein